MGVQPNWTADQLARIKTPIADRRRRARRGDQARAHRAAGAEVPGAKLLILPGVSHFAMLQNPALFNAAVLKFLAD